MSNEELKVCFDKQRTLLQKLAIPGLNEATREGLQRHLTALQQKAAELLGDDGRDFREDERWLKEERRRAVRKYLVAKAAGDGDAELSAELWIQRLDEELDLLAIEVEQGEQVLEGKPGPEEEEDRLLDEKLERLFAAESKAIDREEARDA